MKTMRWAALMLAALMALTIPLSAAAGVTRATNTFDNIPVRGDIAGGGTFRGVLDIVNFRVIDGQLVAVGELTGTLRNAAGDIIGNVFDERVRLPLTFGAITSCDILRLRLGPLDLDLLGLQVHLDRIVLDITAQAGPGNLLGNLLCVIAGLLDRRLDLDTVLRDILRAILEILS